MDPKTSIVAAIGIVIVTITLLALTPTIVDQVMATLNAADAEATEWNFTGAAGAKAMLGLVPFVWVAGVLLGSVVGIMVVAKGKDT